MKYKLMGQFPLPTGAGWEEVVFEKEAPSARELAEKFVADKFPGLDCVLECDWAGEEHGHLECYLTMPKGFWDDEVYFEVARVTG